MRSEGFNRINLDRTIPTNSSGEARITTFLFQSYQSRQINPDVAIDKLNNLISAVSIVSIQTDQSLPVHHVIITIGKFNFNRINLDRSIPTRVLRNWPISSFRVSIVSIQTDQSRQRNGFLENFRITSFNRIYLDRSIPTTLLSVKGTKVGCSFNRINPNRSIPTYERSC